MAIVSQKQGECIITQHFLFGIRKATNHLDCAANTNEMIIVFTSNKANCIKKVNEITYLNGQDTNFFLCNDSALVIDDGKGVWIINLETKVADYTPKDRHSGNNKPSIQINFDF